MESEEKEKEESKRSEEDGEENEKKKLMKQRGEGRGEERVFMVHQGACPHWRIKGKNIILVTGWGFRQGIGGERKRGGKKNWRVMEGGRE